MQLIVRGTAVTFDDDRRVVKDAAIYITGDTIEKVQAASATAPAGYANAKRVRVDGFVYPGLIDLHSHLAYNFLPLWSAPSDEPYDNRYKWANPDTTYGRDVGRPAEAMGIAAAAAALRYAEVKAIVGGVTAIQGSPPLTRPFPGWMVRNIEKERFPDTQPAKQAIYQSVIPRPRAELKKAANHMRRGSSYIYHLAEGTSQKMRDEFDLIESNGCAQQGLIGIHCTALGAADYREWKQRASGGGTVVWSPFSNIWLYGDTTDVLAARRHMHVCLGSDWSPSGTRNLLGELKVAALWNRTALAGELSAMEICEMTTRSPGLALEAPWGRVAGRLEAGALADLALFARASADPYKSLLAANERHVKLVIVGGEPAYGLGSLMADAGVKGDALRVAGLPRQVRTKLPAERQPEEPDLRAAANLSWKAGMARLEAVRKDPAGEVRKARKKRAFGVVPLEYVPDMPGYEASGRVRTRRLDDDELAELVIPPIEPLAHDKAWFDQIDRCHDHAKVLRGLRAMF